MFISTMLRDSLDAEAYVRTLLTLKGRVEWLVKEPDWFTREMTELDVPGIFNTIWKMAKVF